MGSTEYDGVQAYQARYYAVLGVPNAVQTAYQVRHEPSDVRLSGRIKARIYAIGTPVRLFLHLLFNTDVQA